MLVLSYPPGSSNEVEDASLPTRIMDPASAVPIKISIPGRTHRNPFTLVKFCGPRSPNRTVGKRETYAPANMEFITANTVKMTFPLAALRAADDGNENPNVDRTLRRVQKRRTLNRQNRSPRHPRANYRKRWMRC